MSAAPDKFATERTDAGAQTLVHGVRPITLDDRLACRVAAQMSPKRNPNTDQKPCNLGLFDSETDQKTLRGSVFRSNARDQLDLIDAVRATSGAFTPDQPKE
ncbi:hypothetical protein [uncultured Roseobacter sp.]|uniref:hypothetical protein n=1 Tax=uncultured Roseobacter sp. TaxID=114847 RepID=UPI00260370CC|nr:hypothetical protein [uncultured Roseobacter sp.]